MKTHNHTINRMSQASHIQSFWEQKSIFHFHDTYTFPLYTPQTATSHQRMNIFVLSNTLTTATHPALIHNHIITSSQQAITKKQNELY